MDNTFDPGAIRSPQDYRTVNLAHVAGSAPAEPTVTKIHIDYSAVPYLNQNKIGACTNHAFAEIHTHRTQRLNPGTSFVASPRFDYTMCKIEDGVGINNQGTYPVQPFKEGAKYGVVSLDVLPNDTTLPYRDYIYNGVVAQIPQACFTEADKNRVPGFVQVGTWDNVTAADLIWALQQPDGQDGVSILLAFDKAWYTAPDGTISWKKADVLPIRKVTQQTSAHEVTVTGVELEEGTNRWKIFFRNHWSRNWASTSGIEGGTQPEDLDGGDGWFYLDEHPIMEAWIETEVPAEILSLVRSLPKQEDFHHTFTVNLVEGNTGAEVVALQTALKIAGTFPFLQHVTDYFGPITKQAVMDFQREYKIADEATIVAANGEVGPLTREALDNMFAHN